MSAYIVAQIGIGDIEDYREYMKQTPRIIQQFGGRFIVRGGDMETLEGPDETLRIIVIEFPTLDQAKTFYHSNEYSQARKLREGAGLAKLIAIEGYSDQQWEDAVRESGA